MNDSDNDNDIRRCTICKTSIEDTPLTFNECIKCTEDKIKKKKEKRKKR